MATGQLLTTLLAFVLLALGLLTCTCTCSWQGLLWDLRVRVTSGLQ